MHMNMYAQTKDIHKYKVNVNILRHLASLHNRDREEKDQNHNVRQAEKEGKQQQPKTKQKQKRTSLYHISSNDSV